MFDRRERLVGWRALTGLASPPLDVVEFGVDDFTLLGRAAHPSRSEFTADFSGGLLFLIKTIEATDWYKVEPYFTTYAESAPRDLRDRSSPNRTHF